MYLHYLKNISGQQFPSLLTAESKLITAKQVWLQSTFRNFFIIKISNLITIRFCLISKKSYYRQVHYETLLLQ